MLSPDDCCIGSEAHKQQVNKHDDSSARPSENAEETMVIDVQVKKYSPDPSSEGDFKNDDEKAVQSSSLELEKNKKRIAKLIGISKQPNKHKFPKRTPSSGVFLSGNKRRRIKVTPKQNMLYYIDVLQKTVVKQRNIIKFLKLKLKKLEHSEKSECLQSKSAPFSPICGTPDNTQQRIPNNLQKGVNELNQKSLKDVEYSFHDILAENFGDAKNNREAQLRLGKGREDLGIPTGSEQNTCNDEVMFIDNNSEVQIVENDSKVHLHSDEINGKNGNIEEVDEEVIKCIKEFMLREDVSVSDLSVRLKEGGITRLRRHFLSVLYKQFHAEVNSKCVFSQFCKYIPSNVIKPSPTYWKILVCSRCENTELKFMEITNKVLLRKDMSLEEVLAKQDLFEHVSQELGKLKNSQKPFTYTTWAKTLLGKMEASERIVTTTVGSACTDMLKELDLLKEHLIRCYDQYEAVREAREETEISPIHALVHIDWYESPATFVARHLHTSYYYGDGFKTLHAGFVRTQSKSYGFASLSDCRDHTAPAVWASINDILVSLAKEGMKVITVVSDSATAQYRNKGNFYLMRRFAKQNSIEMKWIYLECGHGKGIADAIGASIKQIMCDTIAHHPNKSFRNTMDILPIIKDLTPIKLISHTDHLVQQYKNLLSRQHLQVIPSTYKIHEVCVKETSFYVKESSADKLPFFSLNTQVQ